MLYYFFVLTAAALILLAGNPRKEINRWAAFFLFFAAIGGLTDLIGDSGLEAWARAVQLLNLTFTAYGVLIFSVVYSEFLGSRGARTLKGILLIPILITLVYYLARPAMEINYSLLLLWAVPYYLGACYLHVISLIRESNERKRRDRLITTIIMIPTLIAVLMLIYISRAFSPSFDFFQYISLFLLFSFGVALLCISLYGVLGIRLRFERDPLDNAMLAVSSGAKLLNHTIKNEVGKIAISTDNLQRMLPKGEEELAGQLQIISSSSEHLLAMVERIHSRMKDIILSPEPLPLVEGIERCLITKTPEWVHKRIVVRREYNASPILSFDPVHLQEVVSNLLSNAVEAMPEGGTITILVTANKKGAVLAIEDTGTGIAAESLPHVFEPFFSSKRSRNNYGLGLSYVYNVMRRSGGSVDITSHLNKGTRVTLYFPKGMVR